MELTGTVTIRERLYARNAQTPIGRLPIEVLLQIFEITQAHWDPTRIYPSKMFIPGTHSVFSSGWVCLIHVCSFWRAIIVNSPSLWASPPISAASFPSRYIPDVLHRCRRRSIHLQLVPSQDPNLGADMEDPALDANVRAWFSAKVLDQVGHLTLTANAKIVDFVGSRIAKETVSGGLCHLHTLHVVFPDDDPCLIPKSLWGLENIRDLKLEGCLGVPLSSSLFSKNLERLSITFVEEQQPYSYESMQRWILLMPNLETLELYNFHPPARSENSEAAIVTFPLSLRRLTLDIYSSRFTLDGMEFVKSSDVPPLCSLSIGIAAPFSPSRSDMCTEYRDLLRDVIRRVSLIIDQDPKLYHLYLDDKELIISTTDIYETDYDSFGGPPTRDGSVVNRLALGYCLVRPHMPIDALSCVGLGRLQRITLSRQAILSLEIDQQWSSLLLAKNVRRLDVPGAPHRMTHDHRAILLNALRVRHGSEALFPSLKTLAIDLKPYHDPNELKGLLDQLICTRFAMSAPIEEVLFHATGQPSLTAQPSNSHGRHEPRLV
ncbi:unnamed protein product [Peniophora sp. CBMAI 1063]|nr:unnamed protein product [Peniophora sp. CBMAI 1063]